MIDDGSGSPVGGDGSGSLVGGADSGSLVGGAESGRLVGGADSGRLVGGADSGSLVGGADYGRFVDAVRTLQDLARGAAPPDAVVTAAADLVERANRLLQPYEVDERRSPSGRRDDLPGRGSILSIPLHPTVVDGRVTGTATFRRYHLGRNGAAHGGAVAHLFDSLLGYTAHTLGAAKRQRTAYLHVDYRKIAVIGKELRVDAGIDGIEGRKTFVSGRLLDGDTVLAEAEALFVALRQEQP